MTKYQLLIRDDIEEEVIIDGISKGEFKRLMNWTEEQFNKFTRKVRDVNCTKDAGGEE